MTINSLLLERYILDAYRNIQYRLFGRYRYGVLNPGEECKVEPFMHEINHGDIVHPCIRFISEGFEGHYWWMVYTPYYAADSSMENPILCYSDETDPNKPPLEWKVYGLVNEKPEDGYNSDPTLLYKDGQLYVFWRENYERSIFPHKYIRATYTAKVFKGTFEKSNIEILYTSDTEYDKETCPTFLQDRDGSIIAYAMHLRFHSKRIQKMHPILKGIIEKIVTISDLIGLYAQQKHFGIAIWKGSSLDSHFTYKKTVRFRNCNKLYRPWHMDFFDYKGYRYAIVQTNQCNADICLAESKDMESFSFLKKPLLTNATIGKMGMYKPCAGVTPNGLFYLYYTAQERENRKHNKLYLTFMSFEDIVTI